ncbi:MAG: aspartate/glutamate racemase family protein [Vampirovibrio sp.]|nr:aspartate/glutamate racemase family protein [Vampirovibrio sp.]
MMSLQTTYNPALPTCILMDSGVGGLSVLNTLLAFNIPLNYHYVADTAFMPYGSKPVDLLRSHLVDLFSQFQARWGENTFIALCCNTASVVMVHLPWVPWEEQPKPNFPLLDIITPTVESIAQVQTTKKPLTLGVLATELTIQSGVYQQLLQQNKVDFANFYGIPCPQLAASIEGQPNVPSTETLLTQFLAPLQQTESPLDAVILGCTHYQFVAESIQKKLPSVPLISQSAVMAEKIASAFNLPFAKELPVEPMQSGSVTVWTTGSPEAFQPLIPQFLPLLPTTIVQPFYSGS